MIHVFGAVLVDVIACQDRFIPGSSTIAPVAVRVGGVGHNIYRALDPAVRRLITVVGDGPFSRYVLDELRGEPDALVRTLAGREVGIYVAFMERGRLLHGATDASVLEEGMTPPWLDAALAGVAPGDIVVADANLLAGSLRHLFEVLRDRGAWLTFETVSVEKSARVRDAVRDLYLATPTEEELAALVGVPAPSGPTAREWMHERRIEHLVVTRGRLGLRWLHAGEDRALSPTRALEVADTTGAGDRLLGALLSGLHRWLSSRSDRRPDAALRAAAAEAMPGLLREAMDSVERYLLGRSPA